MDDPAELLHDAEPVAAVREGYELHYGSPRRVEAGDADFALLAGDRLYALGLQKLADEGKLEEIAILAETIASCARSHAAGDAERAQHAWEHATLRLGRPGSVAWR